VGRLGAGDAPGDNGNGGGRGGGVGPIHTPGFRDGVGVAAQNRGPL